MQSSLLIIVSICRYLSYVIYNVCCTCICFVVISLKSNMHSLANRIHWFHRMGLATEFETITW